VTRLRRIALAAILGLTALCAASTASTASTAIPPLVVAIPGPLTGCNALAPSLNESSQVLLDLTRPSAFTTSVQGSLRGEGGAIAAAELANLGPQVVTYSLDTSLHWSDGHPFSAADLIAWWRRGRVASTVTSVGYRDITSMVSSHDGSVVTATFAEPFSAWPLLFRDIEEAGVKSTSCAVRGLLARPSLGPYRFVSLTSSRAVLVSNPSWTASFNRLPRIIVTTSKTTPTSHGLYVTYRPNISTGLLSDLSRNPSISSHIGASDRIEELQYSLRRPLTGTVALRNAWSTLVDRLALIRTLYGGITLAPLPSASLLFSQNEFGTTTTPTTTAVSGQCFRCADAALRASGLTKHARHWQWRGKPVVLHLCRGPSVTDRQTASTIAAQWGAQGIAVALSIAPSEVAASAAAERGRVDVAVFERPVGAHPWLASTGGLGLTEADGFSVGRALPSVRDATQLALSDFNPITAATKWAVVDALIRQSGVLYPLFTPPSVTAWSTDVQNISPSLSELGLIDQVTNWGASTG